MNPEWFGDSYDIVKRFFVEVLLRLGYRVYVDPMPTGDWDPSEPSFLRLLGASHVRDLTTGRTALLLDPDTGVGKRRSLRHTTIQDIVSELENHEIVFVFDQSFSRGADKLPQLQEKLAHLGSHGVDGFYYDSHAPFLFASGSSGNLASLRDALFQAGLPKHRIVLPNGRHAT